MVRKGTLNAIGYVLSVNLIRDWIASGTTATGQAVQPQQSNPQGTISAVLNKITNQDDLNPPSVENARIVFKKTRKTLQIRINSVVDDSKIAGYYVYFGPDMIANPLAAGTFTKKSTLKLKMPVVKKATTYYASFVAQDANGNISQIYGVNYTVRK